MNMRKHIARTICLLTIVLLCVNVVLAHSVAKISNNTSSFKKAQFSELSSKSFMFSSINKEDVNDELLSEFDNETDLEEDDLDTESIAIYTQASFDLFCGCSFIQKDQKHNSYHSNHQQNNTKLPVWLKVRHIIL
jgi:hypothetical protein